VVIVACCSIISPSLEDTGARRLRLGWPHRRYTTFETGGA